MFEVIFFFKEYWL